MYAPIQSIIQKKTDSFRVEILPIFSDIFDISFAPNAATICINNIAIINLSNLQKYHELKKIDLNSPINLKMLKEKNIIKKKFIKLKILGSGEIKNKIDISANFFSKQAKEKIEKIGGKLNILKN